jgi:hypothetical protein
MGFASVIENMISKVEQTFNDLQPRKLEKGWLTLASVLDEVLKCNISDNNFKIPQHMYKDKISRETDIMLPLRLPTSEEATGMVECFEEEEEEEEEVDIWLLEKQLSQAMDGRRSTH